MASRIILWDWECWAWILFKKARKKRVRYHPGQSHRFIISKKQKIEPSVGKKIILIPAKRRRTTKDRLCSVCTLCTQIPTRYLFWQLTLQCSLSRLEDLRYFCGPSKWPLFWSLTKLLLQRCTRRPGLPPRSILPPCILDHYRSGKYATLTTNEPSDANPTLFSEE